MQARIQDFMVGGDESEGLGDFVPQKLKQFHNNIDDIFMLDESKYDTYDLIVNPQ